MKSKNSDMVVKIFLVVVAVILVGLVIAWTTGVFKEKKSDLDQGTERINSAISSMAEFDLLVYDGGTITGSLLLDLIEDKDADSEKLEGVEILYKTLAKSDDDESLDSSDYLTTTPGKEDSKYINPNGLFKGEVKRNPVNNVIYKLIFTQQK